MSAHDRLLLIAMIGCLAITTISAGLHFNRVDARLDAIERTTNNSTSQLVLVERNIARLTEEGQRQSNQIEVLMQWSAYRAFTNATFTSIERTNAPNAILSP